MIGAVVVLMIDMRYEFINKINEPHDLSEIFPECRKDYVFGEYCVYLHQDRSGHVFYVGKGLKGRPYNRSSRSDEWKSIAKNGYSVNILFDNLSNELALLVEKLIITHIGIENLVNKTIGGGGTKGYNHTEKHKRLMSDRFSGNLNPMYGKIPHNKGKKHSKSQLEKMKGPKPSVSGIKNPAADKSVYTFIRHDGYVLTGTRFDLRKFSGMTTGDTSKIVTGYRKKVKGWMLDDGQSKPKSRN